MFWSWVVSCFAQFQFHSISTRGPGGTESSYKARWCLGEQQTIGVCDGCSARSRGQEKRKENQNPVHSEEFWRMDEHDKSEDGFGHLEVGLAMPVPWLQTCFHQEPYHYNVVSWRDNHIELICELCATVGWTAAVTMERKWSLLFALFFARLSKLTWVSPQSAWCRFWCPTICPQLT